MMSLLKRSIPVVALTAIWCGSASLGQGQDEVVTEGAAPAESTQGAPAGRIPSLNYNYYHPDYSGGGTTGQIPAQLYLCPRPVPPYVGHVYITYPPFQPHEWLWIHRRAYYRAHAGGGWTMTTIRWEYEGK